MYGKCRRNRHAPAARGDPYPRHSGELPFLPGFDFRTLWSGSGSAAARDDAFLPALALCRGETLCLLDRRQLSRSLWHACLERSEEHTSELQSLMRISYAVFCLKNKTQCDL